MATKRTRRKVRPARKRTPAQQAATRRMLAAAARRRRNPKRKTHGSPVSDTYYKTKAEAQRALSNRKAAGQSAFLVKEHTDKDSPLGRSGLYPIAWKVAVYKRNPDSEETAAAKLSGKFHGRPARKVRDLTSEHTERYALAELGRLQELIVVTPAGQTLKLEFTKRPRLCSSPEGGALYLEGGDQALPPAITKDKTGKDHLEIGAVLKIVYRTGKGFHDFEPSDYVHDFGEDGGSLPTLGYDRLNKRLYLIGGSYRVKPEGITN